jgi:uncharacterized protein
VIALRLLMALILLGALSAQGASGAGGAPQPWQRVGWVAGFEEGLARAAQSKRPSFVYFSAVWCSWCQRYEQETLADSRIQDILGRRYVPVVVDYDTRPDLFRKYGGRGTPFTLILASDGARLYSFTGMVTARDLADVLETLAKQAAPEQAADVASAPAATVQSLDRAGFAAFRDAYLWHLETLYDPKLRTLAGRYETGAGLSRPSPLTWIYLMERGLWRERVPAAVHAERTRLFDDLEGGFFNFFDPRHPGGGYLETSKLLQSNAWMTAWMAQAASLDEEARKVSRAGLVYLQQVLWDRDRGGFWQAQLADSKYYRLPAAERRRAQAPAVDRAKRADTNAQAAWALTRIGRLLNNRDALKMASRTVDVVLNTQVRDGVLYHIWRDGKVSTPDLPQDWFWLLAAGAEAQDFQADRTRAARLNTVAERAAGWLGERMRQRGAERLPPDLAGLVAWVALRRDLYPALPPDLWEWAIAQLRIEVETPPDHLVLGLRAWERGLERRDEKTAKKSGARQ